MHVLNADRMAVDLTKGRYDLPERDLLLEQCGGGIKEPVEVLLGKIETGKVEHAVRVWTSGQWVQAGQNVPQIAVAINKFLNIALPQQFVFIAKTRTHMFGASREFKTIEENLPFAADALRVRFPLFVFRIYQVCMEAQ